MLTSIAAMEEAPTRRSLTMVDGMAEGKASISTWKRRGTEEVIRFTGAVILRLWVASSDYRVDVRISKTS
jgi:isoleucyl-tRNA synthetase